MQKSLCEKARALPLHECDPSSVSVVKCRTLLFMQARESRGVICGRLSYDTIVILLL